MICHLCKKEINTKKEKYVHVEDWNCEKMTIEMWTHYLCFKKAMNRDLTEIEKQAQEMLKRAGSIFNQIAPQQEDYFIK